MPYAKCPDCGAFLSNVVGSFRGPLSEARLEAIEGDCRRHGRVICRSADSDLGYDDFPLEEQALAESD